jgi:hypothetical protein
VCNQAGLSWQTILRRRAGYRKAFAGFDPTLVAEYDSEKVQELVLDAGIIRHKGKIVSAVNNARCVPNAAAVTTCAAAANACAADFVLGMLLGRHTPTAYASTAVSTDEPSQWAVSHSAVGHGSLLLGDITKCHPLHTYTNCKVQPQNTRRGPHFHNSAMKKNSAEVAATPLHSCSTNYCSTGC